VRRGTILALAALLVGACEAERPIVTKIDRSSHVPSACDRVREIGRASFDIEKREHAIDSALCWIERNSEYRNLPRPFLWTEATDRYIASLGSGRAAKSAAALYNCWNQAVYFVKGFDQGKLGDQSVLLHELVHHAQCVYDRTARDRAAICEREREAYGLQAKFLRYVAERRSGDLETPKLLEAAEKVDATAEEICGRAPVRR
jgi:hypothetical protein